jgi:2-hydroxy-4-(methylsulfanyl)butanoate S-methyltransferase
MCRYLRFICRCGNPSLKATILDFPTVIDTARPYIDAAGMAERIELIGGDAREEVWPTGQDVVLMSYLLSAVDGGEIPSLLSNAYDALKPGGLLVVHDFMLDETRSGPSSAALFFLSYLAHQIDAVSFTAQEIASQAAEAGFAEAEIAVMIPEITQMVTVRKPGGSD